MDLLRTHLTQLYYRQLNDHGCTKIYYMSTTRLSLTVGDRILCFEIGRRKGTLTGRCVLSEVHHIQRCDPSHLDQQYFTITLRLISELRQV